MAHGWRSRLQPEFDRKRLTFLIESSCLTKPVPLGENHLRQASTSTTGAPHEPPIDFLGHDAMAWVVSTSFPQPQLVRFLQEALRKAAVSPQLPHDSHYRLATCV